MAVVTSLSARALGTLIQNWRTSGNGPAYAALAREDQLPWPTLAEVSAAARAFLDPVLATAAVATWNQKHRYARSYLDDHNNLWGEYDVDVSPGGTWKTPKPS